MNTLPLRREVPPAEGTSMRPVSPMVRDIGNQAMALLVEARNYFSATKPQGNTTVVSYYRMVVTNRLIWVMAWVLYQKAVETGEMDSERAVEAMADILRDEGEPEWLESISSDLPRALLSLVYRSGALRERVGRLVGGGRMTVPVPVTGSAKRLPAAICFKPQKTCI